MMDSSPSKSGRDDDDDEANLRAAKAKRVDIEVPMADVDIKLAEKLENVLKISFNTKPKFLTNRVRSEPHKLSNIAEDSLHSVAIKSEKLKPRNLSKEELNERVYRKYDTLVPEKDPRRPKVNVKFLSTLESIELGKDQAKKQMERQLELNSISGNQMAIRSGSKGFRFNDGYEMPLESFPDQINRRANLASTSGSILRNPQDDTSKSSKSVTFAKQDEYETEKEDETEYFDVDNSCDGLSDDSDCSTIET